MHDDAATVLDIVLACRRARRFVEGVSEEAFQADEEKRWAAVSQLMIVGEATNRLSSRFRIEHSNIPWPQLVGMRNRLIHAYDKINWHLVWRTLVEDVPNLLGQLERLVPTDGPAQAPN